ncbi:MAG: hypothetical protein HRU09_10680 [Oligoflexales bacterium]|nr:hypothetical protein [Oligoflexales bacterium]
MFECLLEEFDYQAVVDELFHKMEHAPQSADKVDLQFEARAFNLCELTLLKKAFRPDVIDSLSKLSTKDWYALSFCLRFHITWINFFYSAIQDEGLYDRFQGWRLYFATSRFDTDNFISFLQQRFSHWSLGYLPIVGFSPVGVHVRIRKKGLCRAFDAATITACDKKSDGVYCEDHTPEAWWKPKSKIKGTQRIQASNQSVMYQFYSDPENFYLYSEAELEHLVKRFWSKIRNYRLATPKDIQSSLSVFGLLGRDQLVKIGVKGLRKMFLQKSLECHPDRGGEQEQFIALKSSYEVLKSIIN